ncbi:glycoside hydrolase family 78 protein [Actinophytocola gossypii]|uniref:alpha-L-rhamnosidase n=1 Tax=Actinophytocola gossypii TaxID=2812003 RepID=A0ABT2JEJ1_9PSEU|nr:glycoside hydrolase family 78 protein [Actinophytocola gossypii]MCT2586296.1 family 78 glycoside hydrolase catalytic domain [Actinophytocola gossypii]
MSSGVNRRTFIHGSAAAGALATTIATTARAAAEPGRHRGRLRVDRTTVEYAETLLGTDVTAPRLSWELDTDQHGARQTAYQVRIAGVWDSGKVRSDRTVGIPYGGPPLRPRTRYTWQVRVWDDQDRVSGWSPARWWETGFLDTPWQARWIGAPAPEAPPAFDGASWIWSADATTEGAPVGARWLRGSVDVPAEVTRARVVATADDDFTLYLDGQQVLHAPEQVDGWKAGLLGDVTARVRAGETVLAAVAHNRGGSSVNPAGLLVRLEVELADGQRVDLTTGDGWRVTDTEQDGWQRPDFDDSSWAPATVLAPYGHGPWGDQVAVNATRPAPVLRREFRLDKAVDSARLYLSGLSYYEAELNGRRVGRQVLDPGFTDYDETVLYVTHDVTGQLRRGTNRVDVTLGRGFYGMTTPNVWGWHQASWHGEPRLLAQLEVRHPDGSTTTIASDTDWRVADGPTRSDSLYAGETYDARRAPTDWREPVLQDAPAGTLRAQQHEPIEIADTVRPVAITEPSPGVYVADMGRTMAGWTHLTVSASAGTVVRLAHGEKLRDDGTVISANGLVPGRHQTDEYVCAGTGVERWEPRFSYKGFRYVQVTGLPARPDPDDLLGRLVHSAVPDAGDFQCSEPFFEQLEHAMRRTLLNNFHGIPTDTPMFEKNGWTGDAQVAAPVMLHAFAIQRFFTKWIGDLGDSRVDSGQIPVIVPSGGWGYTQLAPTPEWTTVYPFLVREMYRVYGDDRVAAAQWPTLTAYLDWEIDRLENGLAVTALGDWVSPGYEVPPEDTRLTATSYLYRALTLTAEVGDLLGHTDVAVRYRRVAGELRDALNATFLVDGHYRTEKDPHYRQTSNAVPLMFGMVPDGAVASVVASLVADIRERGNHLNTGILGTSVLLRVLTAHGHADVAHALATQRTYPSWGYWFDNGADTMWEFWPLDSRSRDHYFLGTVVQWLYENVAGLRPGDAGYRRFTVRPDARVGVRWARTSIRTVRGRAAAGWASTGRTVHLTVTVPVGSTAEVHVPAASRAAASVRRGARFLRYEPGFAVYEVAAGTWRFRGQV